MFLDALIALAGNQAVTSSAAGTGTFDVAGLGAGTAYNGVTGGLSTDLLGFDIGAGDGFVPPTLVWNVGTSFVSAGGATLQVGIQAAPDNGSGSAGTYSILCQSGAISVGQLKAGSTGQFVVPPVTPNWIGEAMPRFYQVYFTVNTSTFSAGNITAEILLNPAQATKIQNYPSNFIA